MKTCRKIPYPALFTILLTICLLCGCIRSPERTGPTQTPAPETVMEETDSQERLQASQTARSAFDDLCRSFFENQVSQSYLTLHYTLKNPEDYGITDYCSGFGDFSLDAMKKDQEVQDSLKRALDEIDPELLADDQKLTYRILTKALEYEEAGRGLELYYQPLAPTTGVQAQLPILLTEFTFYEKQDIENYLNLLADTDRYFQQILDFEKRKAEAGLFMTNACVDQIVSECDAYLLAPEHNLMATGFDKRIDEMAGLTEEEKNDFKERNRKIVEEDFIPAYQLLLQGLKSLKGTCTNEQGLFYDPQGKEYYEYLVHSSIGTTYSDMDDLQKAMEEQIDQDLIAISRILKDHPEAADDLSRYQFSETDPGRILELLKQQSKEDFPEISGYSYVTKYVPEELEKTLGPAFFLVPPLDCYDDCTIYINPGTSAGSQTLFTTLAHEGIPGHLYQNVYFLSHCSSNVRKILSFTGYSEGWATYVENYAYTIDNGLSPELGQILAHNASATLGIHALMDLNINYYGWNRQQVADYLKQYFDISQENVVDSIFQAMKNDPSNYLSYYVGYLEIIRMRDQAQETLKKDFRLKDFHTFLLDMGPAPFTVIEPYFRTWLMTSSISHP